MRVGTRDPAADRHPESLTVRSHGTRGRHHSASLPTSTHAVLRPKAPATHLRTRNSLKLFTAGVPGERGAQVLPRYDFHNLCSVAGPRLPSLGLGSARRTLTVSQFAGHACRGACLSPAIRALPPNDTARQARIPVDRSLARGERSRHARASCAAALPRNNPRNSRLHASAVAHHARVSNRRYMQDPPARLSTRTYARLAMRFRTGVKRGAMCKFQN